MPYALHEIPRRVATRVRHLEALPFIVGTNPYVATTLNAYRESFQWLATYPPVTNLEQNEAFAAELEDLVESHANDVPTMAKGYVFTLDSSSSPWKRIIQTFSPAFRNVQDTCLRLKSV